LVHHDVRGDTPTFILLDDIAYAISHYNRYYHIRRDIQ